MDKELKLIIQPKVIDHLGIKMYQKPVDVIAEFIANTWDADSEIAEVTINDDSIVVKDRGIGMTFQQCQDHFLTVGRDRRKETGKEMTDEKKRPILGRKGIGKFSGFGIAKTIEVTTTSKNDGESTSFRMRIQEILEYDASGKEDKPIKVIDYKEPSETNKTCHGTMVSLIGIDGSSIDKERCKEELARRFLLSQSYGDFKISVNNEDLPESFSDEMEFVFPRDLSAGEKGKIPNLQKIDNKGWAVEKFNGYQILWRIGFYEEPINLQTDLGKKIKEWGIERIKLLCSIRKKKRSDKRLQELEDRLEGFKNRLDALPSTERKTVKSVLLKIASFDRLGKNRFHEWCNDILTSWETGRLRELISKISEAKDWDEQKLIEMLSEADVLTALNIAESVKHRFSYRLNTPNFYDIAHNLNTSLRLSNQDILTF